MAMSFLIWTVLHDQINPYHGVQFNLQHGEIPVFGIANVLLREERTTSSYVGGYSGASVRIANGVYYHLGGMRGHRVQSASLQEVDYGNFMMTIRGIYFGGTEHGVNYVTKHERTTWFKIKNRNYSQMAGREKLFERDRHREPVAGWHCCELACAEVEQ